MFLDAKNFGARFKYVKTFMNITHDKTIEYRNKTNIIHTHYLLFQEIPNCRNLEGLFDAHKDLAHQYVQAVINSLHAMFPNMRVFNALFFIPWNNHFYIIILNHNYKFCFITFVQKDPDL